MSGINSKVYSDKYGMCGANIDGEDVLGVTIDGSTVISAGELAVFANAEVDINGQLEYASRKILHGKGAYNISFENCIIRCGNGKMTFENTARLTFTDCTFICGDTHGDDYFIEFKNSGEAEFTRCCFEGCRNFMAITDIKIYANFFFKDCYFHNCGRHMVYGLNVYGRTVITGCCIKNDVLDNNDENGEAPFSVLYASIDPQMFYIFNSCERPMDFIAYNNSVENVADWVILCGNIRSEIRQCTFVNSRSCILCTYAVKKVYEVCLITNCIFDGCSSAVSGSRSISFCRFENSKGTVVSLPDDGFLRYCQFTNSEGTVIEAGKGRSTISDCEFDGIKESKSTPVICLTNDKYEDAPHEITYCKFSNISMDTGFILEARLNEAKTDALIANVHDCEFSGIVTNRSDKRIIRSMLTYDFLLWKNQEVMAINFDPYFKGYDKINKDTLPAAHPKPLEKDSLRLPIGADI